MPMHAPARPPGRPPRPAQLARQFVSAIAEGQHTQRGWPSSMYGVSKLLLSQYTQLLAKELQPAGVMVNAMCPGVSHAMSGWAGG